MPITAETGQSTPPRIKGRERLQSKQSAVGPRGEWRQELISGLIFRPTRPVGHEDGVLTEIAKTAWPELSQPIVQCHLTTTLPGRTRAWGLHAHSTDRLFVVKGLVSIVVYDGRLDSPTFDRLNEFKVSERQPGLLIIPPNLYHGWKVIGDEEAYILNAPSVSYDYAAPDALDLPYESEAAADIVPWRW